jgi:hypothetical protein
MRMHNRRFTRLTNAFSEKFENHAHMVTIYAVWCNVRPHLHDASGHAAMASGLSETVMDEAMDADMPAKKRRPYKKAAAIDGGSSDTQSDGQNHRDRNGALFL